MKFDVGSLPSLRWSGGATDMVKLAQLSEKVGADRFSIADFRYFHECITLMTACAMGTRKIAMESLVTDPFVRHPTLTACAMATIADLSGGRVVLGMGGGMEQPSYWGEDRSRPVRALREAVTVIRSMWRGETVDFEGEIIKCHGAMLRFPLKYKIPILLAARGPKALELSGELADIIHLASYFMNRKHYLDNLDHVKRGLAKGGRSIGDFEVDITVTTCVSDDAEKAYRASVRQAVGGIIWTSGIDKYAKKNYKNWKIPEEFPAPESLVQELAKWDWWAEGPVPERISRLLTKEMVSEFVVFGTPKQIAERYRELMKLPHVGCIRIPLLPAGTRGNIKEFSESLRGIGKAIQMV